MSREALVVGINFYKKIKGFNSLNIPSEDAAEIARILAEEGEFSVTQLPEAVKDGAIRVGQQDGVTQQELRDALKHLFRKGKNAPDTALFYFAGHGILAEDGLVPEGYLVTSDASPGNWGVSLKQLRELLEGSEVRQQLIWLDCCHSGALLNFNQADPKDAGKARDRCFIAASREFEPAYEQLQGNHGVLTGALLQGLNAEQCPAGQWVTNLSLVHSIHQAMEGERVQAKIPQRPIYTIFGGAINLIQGRAQAEKALKNAVSDECPYQGLKAFEEEQKQFFFGRQQVIDKIRQKLNQKAFVPIIGASGSGKSSVVRAGLIPLLKERESGWRVLKPIKPGIEPLTELRGAFKEFFQGAKEKQLYGFIKNDPEGLVKLIERLPDSERFLLVIDQFEEVFTVCPVEKDKQRFIELITQVAENPDSRLAIVTTMRADFVGSSVPTMLNNHETLTGQDFMSFNTFMPLKLLPSKALINHQLIFSTLSTEEPKTTAIDPRSGAEVPLFNPRQHSWSEHFIWSADGLLIIGLAPIGRATVATLVLNRERVIKLMN